MAASSRKRTPWWVRIAPLVAVAGFVVPQIIYGATRPAGGTIGTDLLVALVTGVLLAPLGLAIGAAKAANAVEEVNAIRPRAVVARCLSSQLYTGLFLKPGPANRFARGGGYALLVADDDGIEIYGIQKKTWFGLVPWDRVKSISLGTKRTPLRSRPTLIVDIDARYTPYEDQFELLLEGPDRARAALLLAEITARRPGPGLPASA